MGGGREGGEGGGEGMGGPAESAHSPQTANGVGIRFGGRHSYVITVKISGFRKSCWSETEKVYER